MKLLAAICLAGVAVYANAQSGYIYVTDGTYGQGYTHILHGGGEISSYKWAGKSEMPIVVTGSGVNQAASSGDGSIGHRYSLTGTQIGPNAWSNGNVPAYDAATNGRNIFTLDWDAGTVKAWGMNYDGVGTTLFNAAYGDLGITYDTRSGTLFTANWYDGKIRDWSMTGSLLSTWDFGVGFDAGALAYDSTDNSLWFKDNNHNRMDQLNATTGALIGGYNYSNYVLGAEAQAVPEPMPVATLGLGCLIAIRRRKRA